MKMTEKILKNNKNLLIILLLFTQVLSGCRFSIQNIELKRGQSALEANKFDSAIVHFENVLKLKPSSDEALNAARTGSRVAILELSKYEKAIYFYRHLVLYSSDEEERKEAQKKIANIYFEKLSNYLMSISEFSKLLSLPKTKKEELEYRYNIAKAYFYLNNFYQAGVEIEEILKLAMEKNQQFEYLAFKGNLFLTSKNLDGAISVFDELIKTHPEESIDQNVPISLAVAYEEKGNYEEAIEVLESIKMKNANPEFIELRIQRLKERVLNQPGARGLKR